MTSPTGKLIQLRGLQSSDYRALVPPGQYQLALFRRKIVTRFERDILELWFTVLDFGEYFEKRVPAYYSIHASAKRRSFLRWKPPDRSDRVGADNLPLRARSPAKAPPSRAECP